MTKPIDLKPCPVPKCGGYAERVHVPRLGYGVKCANCGLSTKFFPRQCEATADWHRKVEAFNAKPQPQKKPRRPRKENQHHGGRR